MSVVLQEAGDAMAPSSNVTRLPRRGRPRAKNRSPLGIYAVETALDIFQCVIESEGGVSLSSLSRKTGLQPSKLHRYLVSLVKYGYLSQSDVTGVYDLGVGVRQLGVAAFNRFDEMKVIGDAIYRFALERDCTLFHYIWTEMGPTLINVEFGNHRPPVALRVGSVLPLCGSASGRVFLAYLPKSVTAAVLKKEKEMAKAAGLKLLSDRELEAELRKIKSSLVYTTNQTIASNITFAAVAPILDRDNRLFSTVIAVPPPGHVDAELVPALEVLVAGLSKTIFGEGSRTTGRSTDHARLA
jgi:DNA-binding IclR family transcriptional regulator